MDFDGDDYYEYFEPSDIVDAKTIMDEAFTEIYDDIRKCRYISFILHPETNHPVMRLVFADSPFGFSI